MTWYIVEYESCEERSKSDEVWTKQDLLDAYSGRTVCEPYEMARFKKYDDAVEYVKMHMPDKARIQSVNVGHVVLYEVAIIEEYDEEREEWSNCGIYVVSNDKDD